MVFSTRLAPAKAAWAAADLILVLASGAILELDIGLPELAALVAQGQEALQMIRDPKGRLEVVIPDPQDDYPERRR